MSHEHPGENNELKDAEVKETETPTIEVNEDGAQEAVIDPSVFKLPQLTEMPVRFNLDGTIYKIKYDLVEEDITPAGIAKMQKLNHLLIFSMSPQFNADLGYYIEQNGLKTLLVEDAEATKEFNKMQEEAKTSEVQEEK